MTKTIWKCRPNRVRRAYRGGKLLDAWQGKDTAQDTGTPEEWMASTVDAFNKDMGELPHEGLSVTQEGDFLRDLIASDPEGMLGEQHVAAFGQSMGILVKALDAGDRLAVQVHPDREKAMEFFCSPFGKTEAWYILATREDSDACIYAGFRETMPPQTLRRMFEEQDIGGMLAAMNRVKVNPGDVFLIEGGLPHAIGAGCLLVEIQEPTDITLRLERRMPSGHRFSDIMCHNGVGFDRMFRCVDYCASHGQYQLAPQLLEQTPDYSRRVLISHQDTPAFALEEIQIQKSWQGKPRETFSLLVGASGAGRIAWDGGEMELKQGECLFVPALCTGFTVTGSLTLLQCFPPKA